MSTYECFRGGKMYISGLLFDGFALTGLFEVNDLNGRKLSLKIIIEVDFFLKNNSLHLDISMHDSFKMKITKSLKYFFDDFDQFILRYGFI